MYDRLVTYLLDKDLAWEPAENYYDGPDYLEMLLLRRAQRFF